MFANQLVNDLDTELDLHRIMSGFHGVFGMSAGSVPLLGTRLCSNCWDSIP